LEKDKKKSEEEKEKKNKPKNAGDASSPNPWVVDVNHFTKPKNHSRYDGWQWQTFPDDVVFADGVNKAEKTKGLRKYPMFEGKEYVGSFWGADPLSKGETRGLCDRLVTTLKPFLSFFQDLWAASGSGTNDKREKGGVIGIGSTTAGGKEVPQTATFGGQTYEDNMGPDFARWVMNEAGNFQQILFWVHTHPNGTREPSPLPGSPKKTGDKPTTSFVGIDGIVLTANTLGVFNEVGLYCEYDRTAASLSRKK
jgi:hypothetical protein